MPVIISYFCTVYIPFSSATHSVRGFFKEHDFMTKQLWRQRCVGMLLCATGVSVGAYGMSDDDCISQIEDDVVYEQRAMIRAVRTGDADAVDELLLQGVDANTFDGDEPAIMVALRRGYWHVARRLFENCPTGSGIDPNLAEATERGTRPLHTATVCAEHEEHLDVVRQLMTAQTVNSADGDGLAPLHYAASRNDELGARIAELLLKKGAQFNVRDRGQRTPLIVAAELGNMPLVRCLINFSTMRGHHDLFAIDAGGYTARAIACQNGHTKVANLLHAAEERARGHRPDRSRAKRLRPAGTGVQITLDGWVKR